MLQQCQGTFFHDDSKGDYGSEAMLDLEISWVLRTCLNQNVQRLKPKLYYQCRYILNTLLGWKGKKDCLEYAVEDVHVWKQWKHIDIVAEVKIDGKLHVLILEDKAYTKMTDVQRDKYPEYVESYYLGRKPSIHYCVVSLYGKDEDGLKELTGFVKGAAKKKWKVYSTETLVDWLVDDYTESDLFNEFWFAKW